jgi:hypothetical protein
MNEDVLLKRKILGESDKFPLKKYIDCTPYTWVVLRLIKNDDPETQTEPNLFFDELISIVRMCRSEAPNLAKI